jgi:hypothetical protein
LSICPWFHFCDGFSKHLKKSKASQFASKQAVVTFTNELPRRLPSLSSRNQSSFLTINVRDVLGLRYITQHTSRIVSISHWMTSRSPICHNESLSVGLRWIYLTESPAHLKSFRKSRSTSVTRPLSQIGSRFSRSVKLLFVVVWHQFIKPDLYSQ